MKKSLLTLSAIAIVSALSAQITITQNDIAPLYSTVLQNHDTMPTVTPGNAGANQTYNLTALNAHTTDTLLFTLPQFTSHGSNFPGSNLAVTVNTNQAYLYFNSSNAEFDITGQAADPFGSGIIDMPYSNFETQLIFPTNYNSSFIDTAKGEGWTYLGYDPGVGFQIDSVHVHVTVFKNSLVDGWGTATTPLGTYNVLRVNTLRHEIDSVDVQAFNSWIPDAYTLDDSTRSYTYWANGIGFQLAQLDDHQDLGSITAASWIPATPAQTGISEFANVLDMSAFPNPSIETVTFATKDAHVKAIRIFDASGSLVKTATVESNNTVVNVTDLSTGMYFYQAIDANGTILGKGKINITH